MEFYQKLHLSISIHLDVEQCIIAYRIHHVLFYDEHCPAAPSHVISMFTYKTGRYEKYIYFYAQFESFKKNNSVRLYQS